MKLNFRYQEKDFLADFQKRGDVFEMDLLEKKFQARVEYWSPPFFRMEVGGQIVGGAFYRFEGGIDVHLPEGTFRIAYIEADRGGEGTGAAGGLTAPMPGKVFKVLVNSGDEVEKGTPLLILEAMKMEQQVLSPMAGVVKRVLFSEGDRVDQGVQLIEIE